VKIRNRIIPNKSEQGYEPPLEQKKEKTDNSTVATVEKKKKWWVF